ncbi:M50 family metallopeptidase [Salinigranum halophilum]|jgi:Zn-dependent protease/CBS domain-containing protein|uniref:M50 family metallopeptidase n=1 Tax=Salinigranum halophilum TaxID=2565931 RepID=UPI0010A87739|nr:M50 family metallopeptidase [Salinigranum halophilum]
MRGIRIGSAFGIPIRLDITFLLVLPLFAWLIGSDVSNLTGVINSLFGTAIAADPLTAGSMRWVLGSAAALGLFFGVLLHEFGHSLVAMRYGYEIESITLWLFGGVARFTEIPEDWKQEFTIAVAGPIVSILVGIVSYVGFVALPLGDPVKFVLGYLALTNVALAVFNMLPGFPMDGGRVLRALLARNRPHARATQLAAEVGKIFAFLLGLFGLFANLFLVALAFFIYMGASSEAQQTVMKAAFQDVIVRDIMTPREELHVVDERASVAELLEQMFRERHTGYPVMHNGQLVGMVTLDDARGVREVERDAYRVEEVMSRDLATITPDADAMEAITLMQQHGVGRLPVVENGEFVGLVSRSDLVTAFNIIQSRGSLDSFGREPSLDVRP